MIKGIAFFSLSSAALYFGSSKLNSFNNQQNQRQRLLEGLQQNKEKTLVPDSMSVSPNKNLSNQKFDKVLKQNQILEQEKMSILRKQKEQKLKRQEQAKKALSMQKLNQTQNSAIQKAAQLKKAQKISNKDSQSTNYNWWWLALLIASKSGHSLYKISQNKQKKLNAIIMMYFFIVSTPITFTCYKISMQKLRPYILAYKGISFLKKIKSSYTNVKFNIKQKITNLKTKSQNFTKNKAFNYSQMVF